MKILHIAHEKMYQKDRITGIKTVLEEQVLLEREIESFESYILGDNLSYDSEKYLSGDSEREIISKYKPDLVIFDGFWDIRHVKIANFLKKNKIKYFIKPHGSFDKISLKNSFFKMIKKKIAKKLIFDKYVENSLGLLYLNHEEKAKSVYEKKSFIQPNVFNKNIDLEKWSIKQKKSGVKIVYVGRINFFHKGLDILLETILLNKNKFEKKGIYFEFYGKGLEKSIIKMREYEKKIGATMKFQGVIMGDKKFEMLSGADIFIHTSRFEGQPMALLEALSVEIPCIVSKGTNMKEVIEKSQAGWGYENQDDLLNLILQAVSDYKEDEIFYKKNAKKCSELFLWKSLKDKYSQVYREMEKMNNDI